MPYGCPAGPGSNFFERASRCFSRHSLLAFALPKMFAEYEGYPRAVDAPGTVQEAVQEARGRARRGGG